MIWLAQQVFPTLQARGGFTGLLDSAPFDAGISRAELPIDPGVRAFTFVSQGLLFLDVILHGSTKNAQFNLLGPIPHHANINLSVNVRPLFRGANLRHQLIEGHRI